MEPNIAELKIKGKTIKAQSTCINNNNVVVTGKWIKMATVEAEKWLEGQVVNNPEFFVARLKNSRLKADIFTFAQRLPNTQPRYGYYMEWDNLAVIPITSFDEWWTKRATQVTRKNVRRAKKRGVVVKLAKFDNELVEGILKIYNESPVRQGRFFWHYGKDFDTVKKENSSYMSNSDFICAYHNYELIGFIKLVYTGKEARIMQIISMTKHQDKRPTNALIAKAVEICEMRNMEFFIYGEYIYGKNTRSPLIEFKRRNGFEMFKIPRYYIPLNIKGEVILKIKLHHGIVGLIPEKVYSLLLNTRAKWYQKKFDKAFIKE